MKKTYCLAAYWIATVSLVGCTSLHLNPLASKHANSASTVENKDAVGECEVTFQATAGKTEKMKVSLKADSTVQDVLNQCQGTKKFTRFNLALARPLPSGGWHKMDVEYDRGARRVSSSHDYSVQPGDRLLVSQDSRTIFDDMVESAMGPSAKSIGTRLLK
jgi:hypothetical protein